MVLELIERLAHHGATRPNSEALRRIDPAGCDDLVMTYAQLCGAVLDVAVRLGSELPPGAVIILSYPNELEFTVAFLASLAAGVTVFPVHPQSTDAELRSAAECCGAVAVAGTPRAVEVLRSLGAREVDVSAAVRRVLDEETEAATHGIDKAARDLVELGRGFEDGPNLLLQSSGTTGPPKIVRRGGASLDAVARNVADSVGLSPDDRVLGLIPACHSYGVENLTLGPVFAGACVHLCGRLEPHAILRQLEVSGITVFPGVPAMFEMLAWAADRAKKPSLLRCAYSAGAFLPRGVCDSFEKRLGVRIGQLFGMTEIGSVTFNDPEGADFDPTSVGLPMAGVRVRIVDPDTRDFAKPLSVGCDGEVAVAAPSMLMGYVRAPDRPCEPVEDVTDGFFLTGDQGHVDESGRLTITGRLKLVVDVGGLKVNLMEVEAALREHAGVRDCAVVPIAVSETQSRLKAFIVPSAAECPPSSDELRRHLRARLSAHKVPRMFESREALPRSATGKVQRGELR